ncbi:hypothetical protein [Marinobacter salicampi]|uniref:hypothetical protein n=1 Tax=Marinobacter salicampi TaxID=435907 RepID=UPI001407FF00|nr:hypothetical protein [Marinobacter salicampi]
MTHAKDVCQTLEEHLKKHPPFVFNHALGIDMELEVSNKLHTSWTSIPGTKPCGSLYPDPSSTINHSKRAISHFAKARQSVAVVSKNALDSNTVEQYLAAADREASRTHSSYDEALISAASIINFLVDSTLPSSEAPIGVIAANMSEPYFGYFGHKRQVTFCVELNLVHIRQEVRGKGLGPLLAGTVGFDLGEALSPWLRRNWESLDELVIDINYESQSNGGSQCAQAIADAIRFFVDPDMLALDIELDLDDTGITGKKIKVPKIEIFCHNEY